MPAMRFTSMNAVVEAGFLCAPEAENSREEISNAHSENERRREEGGKFIPINGAGTPSRPILPVVSSVPQTAVAPLRIPSAFAPSHKLAPAEKTDSGRPSSAQPPSATPG